MHMSLADLPPAMRAQAEAQLDTKSKAAKPKANKTELAFGRRLEAEKRAGKIRSYKFNALKFRLADACFYTPDYVIWQLNGMVKLVEVKGGFIREDSLIKFKVAREMYSEFNWEMWQSVKGRWERIR